MIAAITDLLSKRVLRRTVAVLFLHITFFTGSVSLGAWPRAANGVLDLSQYNFTEDGPLSLNGEWNFYFRRLVDPANIEHEPVTKQVKVPSSWNNISIDGLTIPGTSCATYYLKVILPQNMRARELAIRSVLQMTAHRIFINGEKILEMGMPSCNPDENIARTKPIIAEIPTEARELNIVLHISNFIHRRGGPLGELKLGLASDLQRTTLLNRYIELFTFGALAFAIATYLIIFLTRRTEQVALLFSTFSFLILIRLLVTGEKVLLDLFPNTPYSLVVFLEFNSWFFLVPTGTHFVASFFPGLLHPSLRNASYLAALVFFLFSIMTPLRVYSYSIYPYTAIMIANFSLLGYILFKALIEKRTYAVAMTLGVGIMIFFVINDLLYLFEIFKGGVLLHFGYIGLVGTNALILAHKYIQSFSRTEMLSRELSKLNADLEQIIQERSRQIKAEQESAMRNLELKNHFLSLVSHDLRNPVSILSGYFELLNDEKYNSPEQEKKMRQRAQDALSAIIRIMDTIFTYDRLKSGSIEINRKPIRLNRLLADSVKFVETIASEKGIQIDCDTEHDMVIETDYLLTREILYNFLLNAVHFSPRNSIVRVYAEDHNGRTAISVEDRGPGIAEEMHEQIFKFRSSPSSSGGGIGLPLCYAIASAMNARIKLRSQPGQGSKFTLVLPL